MAGITEIYGSLAPAFGKSTLRLIRNPHARVYLSLIKAAFPDASRPMPAEDLWAFLDASLTTMEQHGIPDLPVEDGELKAGRALCRELIDQYSWLESSVTPGGRTEYRLTSDATEAISIIDRLNSSEGVMGASRMHTLVEAIERASVLFSADYEAGHRVLQQRLEQAQAELDEYEARGGAEPLTPERARDIVRNLQDLMDQLPHDLRRLEEDVHGNATALITSFREDERPVGEVIKGYLAQGRNLVANTEHGRSFLDAVRVIGDSSTSEGIVSKLELVAEAPLSDGKPLAQATELERGWSQISRGIAQVNTENTRASRVIGRSIAQHDVSRDRELTAVLKQLESAANAWARRVPARAVAPFVTSTQKWDVATMASRLANPSVTTAPPGLDRGDAAEVTLSVEELRRIGGPQTKRLLEAMLADLPLEARGLDLAQGFNALPGDLRRPVELAGFVQMAASLGLDPEHAHAVPYRCVDLTGRDVVWIGPRIRVTIPQAKRAAERM